MCHGKKERTCFCHQCGTQAEGDRRLSLIACLCHPSAIAYGAQCMLLFFFNPRSSACSLFLLPLTHTHSHTHTHIRCGILSFLASSASSVFVLYCFFFSSHPTLPRPTLLLGADYLSPGPTPLFTLSSPRGPESEPLRAIHPVE